MTVKSEVSPFGSVASTSESLAAASPPLPHSSSKTEPPSLTELVLDFWKAVNCVNSVGAYDVAEELSQKRYVLPTVRPSQGTTTLEEDSQEEEEGKQDAVSPTSGVDYWKSAVKVNIYYVEKDDVCLGKVGQGKGIHMRGCIKNSKGKGACQILAHKTKVPGLDLMTSGFYVGAPMVSGTTTSVMIGSVLPDFWFADTQIIENWKGDRSAFASIKMTPGDWKLLFRYTPRNLVARLNAANLQVDVDTDHDPEDHDDIPTLDLAKVLANLTQQQELMAERLEELEAMKGVYQGMIEEHKREVDHRMQGNDGFGRAYGTVREDSAATRNQIRSEMRTEISTAMSTLTAQVQATLGDTQGSTQAVQDLRETIYGSGGFADSIEKRIDRLAQQVSGNGVEVGDFRFNCLLDVETWMSAHLKNANAYGVFWDAVVALCSVPKANVEFDSVMANKKAVESGKFTSVWNARHFSSFQTTYPPVLFTSASSTGLSAINARNKWTMKGQTGVKHDVLEGIKRASEALKKEIRQLLQPGSEASRLAETMHTSSVGFIREWISEMDSLYEDFVAGGMQPKSAWEICLLLSKALFAKLRDARAVALDSTTPAVMLWASLQAHKVMQEFLHHEFRNHPHFAAVIVQTHILGNAGMTTADVDAPMAGVRADVSDVQGELEKYKKVANKRFTDAFSRLKAVEESIAT